MLTPEQLPVLAAAMASDPALTQWKLDRRDDLIAGYYNEASSPAFIAWKSNVTIADTAKCFNGAEWAGMTSANHTRLTDVVLWIPAGYNAGLPDIRAMFNDIWSGAGGATTRANLLTAWKRTLRRGERLFATGTGSDGVPGLPGSFEGLIATGDVSAVLNV